MTRERLPWLCLIVLCLVPRAIGLAVNEQANDNHLEVVELWLQAGHYPNPFDCRECFQPPLYYGLIHVVASALGAHDRGELLLIAHGWNLVFSLLILVSLARWIDRSALSRAWKWLLLLFVGLNPKLIAINIQATNDTLVILLGCAVLQLSCALLESYRLRTAALLGCGALLASITKGNGLVLLVGAAGVASFATAVRAHAPGWEKAALLFLFVVSLPAASAHLGGYLDRYERTGDAFVINQTRAPAPPWFGYDDYDEKRMGVRSIADAFGTFRFVDLMRHPYIMDARVGFHEHRTSFWTQLYGQAFHAQFERYPPSWKTTRTDLDALARCLYVLGLVPLALLVWGCGLQLAASLRVLRSSGLEACLKTSTPFVFFLGFLAFLIQYSIDYRDFAAVKLIFILPALLAFVDLLDRAIQRLRGTLLERPVYAVLSLSCVGFVLNVYVLLETLIRGAAHPS